MPTSVAGPWTPERIAEHRQVRFRQRHDLRLTHLDEAAAFIDDVGLCLFSAAADSDLPTFYNAVVGRTGPAPGWGDWDQAAHQAWSWKDKLFADGRVYYGKPLGDHRVLMSRELLPYLHAGCARGPSYAEEDYLELYQDGQLTPDARQLYEALLKIGAGSTAKLRRVSIMDADKGAHRRFEKALTELQRAFLVAAVGIDTDNAWKYTFRYAPLARAFPREVALASELSSRDAMRVLIRWFLGLAGAVTAARVGRLFGWETARLERVLVPMIEAGEIGRSPAGLLWLVDPA